MNKPPKITDVYQVVTVTEPYREGDDRVEPGTYVVGGEYADNDCTEVWVHVDFALDTDGNDATRYVAERIKTSLSAQPVAPPQEIAEAIRLLTVAAEGRRTYARRAPEQMRDQLETEAAAYESAAEILRNPQNLKNVIPTWQWDQIEAGAA